MSKTYNNQFPPAATLLQNKILDLHDLRNRVVKAASLGLTSIRVDVSSIGNEHMRKILDGLKEQGYGFAGYSDGEITIEWTSQKDTHSYAYPKGMFTDATS